MVPHLGVTKLPPWVTVDGLPTHAELQAFMDAREVALALQAIALSYNRGSLLKRKVPTGCLQADGRRLIRYILALSS